MGITNHIRSLAGLVALGAVVGGFAAGGASAAGVMPIQGVYEGSGKKVTAEVAVSRELNVKLSFDLTSRCGALDDSMTLKRKKNGKYVGVRTVGKRSVTASLKLNADATVFTGKLRDHVQAKHKRGAHGGACVAKRSFTATLGETDAYVPVRDVGHYVGTDPNGRPLSFDVLYEPNGNYGSIANITVDVDAECWEDLDEDGNDDTIVAHLSGYGGEIAPTGEFSIEYIEGEDVEYTFDGTVAGGEASMEVVIGGFFDPDGTPNSAGALSCDSWGSVYRATAQ